MTAPHGMWCSVDPGVSYYAAAYWRDKELSFVGLLPIEDKGMARLPLCVIEKPQVYKATRVRNRDIEDLLFAAGRIAERHDSYVAYLPSQWKGQLPKAVHHARILSELTEHEKTCLEGFTKTERGHIVDAIGLGLYHSGRMK